MKKVLAVLISVSLFSIAPVNAASMKSSKALVELPYTKSDQVSDVVLTPVSVILIGTTESPNSTWISGSLSGSSDAFVASYSSIGAPLWNLRLGQASSEIATSAAIDTDGSIWVVGASSGSVVSSSTPTPSKILNPDNVILDQSTTTSTPMNRVRVWQISNTGILLNAFEFVSENVINPKKILITGSNLSIVGTIYGKAVTQGFYLSVTKNGVFSPLVKIGSKSTQLNDSVANADGTLTVVGTSGDLLLKSKSLSKSDAITLKLSILGEVQQVARATLKNTTRVWDSIDDGLLQAGAVRYSNKTEAAITKFSALGKPTWNFRYSAKSTALAADGKNAWVTFVSSGAITGVPSWKPKNPTPVLLGLGKKGEVVAPFTLTAPAVAIEANNEIGTVVITDSGVSFGLVVVN